jgi:hypothetical protein
MTHEQTSMCWQWPWAIPMDTLSAICQIVPLFWMCNMWKLGQSFWRGSKNVDCQFILSIATSQWNFHQFVFVLLLLLSSSCSFYEVGEHFSETSELMHLIFCKVLLIESCCPLLDLTYAPAVYFTLVSFLQQNGHVDFAEQSCRFRLVFLWDKKCKSPDRFA